MEVNTTANNDESNGGDNYSEIQTADDARHVEVGDTVSVEINARPEREDCDEAVSTEPLVDCFEAEVTDVVEKLDGEHMDIKLDTGEIVSVTTRGSRSIWRQYACYSNHDDHNPENRVRITVVTDDEDDEPDVATDGGVDVTDESNGGENNYVEIQNADDAQNVEVGDTVSVEINAYPECDDRERAFRKGTLTDSYEATVTDVAENRPALGIKWGIKLTLDNGDELSICSDGARELERDNEWYTSYDTHYPENKVSIAVVADDVRLTVEGGEVVSDEALDRIEDMVSEMGHAGSLIQNELRDSKQGNDEIREQANTIVGASNRFDQLLRDLRNSGETSE